MSDQHAMLDECTGRTEYMAERNMRAARRRTRRWEAECEESSVPRGSENCASRLDRPSASHLRDCPWRTDPAAASPVLETADVPTPDVQVWERRVPGTDVAEVCVRVTVGCQGGCSCTRLWSRNCWQTVGRALRVAGLVGGVVGALLALADSAAAVPVASGLGAIAFVVVLRTSDAPLPTEIPSDDSA